MSQSVPEHWQCPRCGKWLSDDQVCDSEACLVRALSLLAALPQGDFKQCPWCATWWAKDDACNRVVCGLAHSGAAGGGGGEFHVGVGCGGAWCFECGKRLCGPLYSREGARILGATDDHDADCCARMPDFSQETYCCGGHNSHTVKRWE